MPVNDEISRRRFVKAASASLGVTALVPSIAVSAASKDLPSLLQQHVMQKAPLASVPYLALPLGSVRARGWVHKQLKLQRDGLTGHADRVLPSLTRESSAWLAGGAGDGEGWEKGPYYAKGLVALAFTLNDGLLIEKAVAWVEAILGSQRADGFYGPLSNDDWWPRMVANYLIRDYAEATGDTRIPPFLARYYRHLQDQLPQRPLREWGRARAGDEIDTVLWLYNRTGDAELLRLADLLAQQAYPWQQIFQENLFLEYGNSVGDFHPKHAVNVAQALKMPAVYWQRSGSADDRRAYRTALDHLMRDHGTSFGINTGTEMLSGRSTVDGVELCAIVENMLSAETAIRLLGDARIGDELEMVAFNALPAAMSHDFRQHVYYTLANNVSATSGHCGYEVDYADGRTPAPRSGCPCCCYNLHMGWPKFVQNSWAATPTGGLALLAYMPSEVTAHVSQRATARVVCDTEYPFADSVSLTLALSKTARFPMHLRIPGWCRRPMLTVNGEQQPAPQSGEFTVVERTWESGDRIDLRFPMQTAVVRGVNSSATVTRGPLVYSLAMAEQWRPVVQDGVPGFESYEVTSATPWNYALVLDETHPDQSFQFSQRKPADNPFRTGSAPVSLRAKARRLDAWQLRSDGLLALDPPVSPVAALGPDESIELVPFGSQMLRITSFPVVGNPSPLEVTWDEGFVDNNAAGWIVYRGGLVRDRRLHLPRGAKAIATSTHFADLAFAADVVVGTAGDAGVMFRVAEPSIGIDHYRGYYVGINAEAGEVVVGKADNAWHPLARQAHPIVPEEVHRLKVEADGSQIRVWVDEATDPVLTTADDSYISGMVGVRSYANSAAFGRLRVSALS